MANNNFQIRVVVTEGDLEQVRALFREYFTWVDTIMRFDMTYQGVEQELKHCRGHIRRRRVAFCWLRWMGNRLDVWLCGRASRGCVS